MFLGTMKKGKSLEGYVRNNLLELSSLRSRHDALAKEILRRGYNHKSDLELGNENLEIFLSFNKDYPMIYKTSKVNSESSLQNLHDRCLECRRLMTIYNILPKISSAGVIWSEESDFKSDEIKNILEKQ
jgi:hypothetical protein